MADRPVIEIPSPEDPTLGWLSNASKHPFTIDSLEWPTVDHYLLAKKFEGTTLEEQIRGCRSLYSARLLTTPKNLIDTESGVAVKKTVYGKEKNFDIREDWSQVYYSFLETALIEKFKQHPVLKKKLMGLAGMEIIDPKSSVTGDVLERLRDILIEDLKPRYRPPSFPQPYKDLTSSTLTPPETQVLKSLVRAANMIGELEGTSILQQGVFEDAIYNILTLSGYDGRTAGDVVSLILEWVATAFSEWAIVVKTMPHFDGLVTSVTSFLPSTKMDEEATFRIRVIIASFIRWLRADTSKIKDTLFTKAPKIRMSDITIPAKIRSYRAIPTKIYTKRKENSVTPVPVEVPSVPPGKPPIEESDVVNESIEDPDADIQRGVIYIKTFLPLSLPGEVYSKVVGHLETLSSEDRGKWLDTFNTATIEEQKKSINAVV